MCEFAQVLEDPTPFPYSTYDGCEMIIEKDHVRGILGHVGPGDAHRDTYIGFLYSRRVVYAVSGHRYNLPVLLPCANDPELMFRGNTGIDRYFFDYFVQFIIA